MVSVPGIIYSLLLLGRESLLLVQRTFICLYHGYSKYPCNLTIIFQVLEDASWPADFREDLGNFNKYLDRARDMLKPVPYDQKARKTQQVEKVADKLVKNGVPDIEDMASVFHKMQMKPKDEFYYKLPL